MNQSLRFAIGGALAVAYAASLAIPAIDDCSLARSSTVLEVLITGPLGVLIWQFGWFANVLCVPLAASFVWRGKVGAYELLGSAVMVGLALQSITLPDREIPLDYGSTRICEL